MQENEELATAHTDESKVPVTTYKPGLNKLDAFNWLKDIAFIPS